MFLCSITLVVCFALGFGALYLYRAYRIADVVTDEASQDNISRFMTGAYTDYRVLTEEEFELRLARENAESYYDAYFDALKADKPRKVTEFFSSGLKNLWDKAYEVPDWDLFLLAQDWDNPSFEILSVNGNSKEAEVEVKVRNFGQEKINTLRLVREGSGYLIDNFIADGYNLKELLTAQD